MDAVEKDIYYKGYVAGYREGMRDALDGHSIDLHDPCAGDIPIHATKLSVRAKNCLVRYGCKYLRDAATFDGERIRTMRNLGTKTAAEIARYLDSLGICHTAWNAYLG